MFYPFYFESADGNRVVCRVPDLDFYAVGETEDDAFKKMSEGLINTIDEKYRKEGRLIPMPGKPKQKGSVFYIGLRDEARFLLWNILKEKRLSVSELGRMLGVSRQQAHHMITGANAVSLDKYCEAFEALGYYLSLELNPYR